MNDKIAEEDFILSILTDLKGYPEHNKEELDYLIQFTKYRKDQLENALVESTNPKKKKIKK